MGSPSARISAALSGAADPGPDLADSLRACGLGEAAAALRTLEFPGARIVVRARSQKASALILAYARRRLLLASFHSPYVARLRRAIGELTAGLRPFGAQPVELLDIRCGRRRCFLVFRLGGGGPLLGCLPYAGEPPPSQ